MQSHIYEAMQIEKSWIDKGLDTLRLVELYGEDGQMYEDSRVVKMLADDTANGRLRLRLLRLLKQCDIDWIKDSKCLPWRCAFVF